MLFGGRAIGEVLVDHAKVPLVSATGSTAMGRVVGPRLASRFARALLELGGNNAALVAPTADLDLTLRGVAFAAMGTAGQRCTTLRRLFVHESVYDSFVPRLKQAYACFAVSVVGMGGVKQQFFPTSDRPESAGGGSAAGRYQHETTTATVEKLERWLHDQPEAKIVTSYVGQGAPRFVFAMAPELPDPAFAKVVVLTPHTEAREDLKHRLGQAVSQGLAPEANVRVTQLVFGPYTPFPVEFRVMGPDPAQLYAISEKALGIMRGVPDVRQANRSRIWSGDPWAVESLDILDLREPQAHPMSPF